MVLPEDRVILFLRYPSSALVEFAITMANLTEQEEKAIYLCGRRKMTQELVSRQTGFSVDSIQRWYRAGIKKLSEAWAGSPWIWKLTEN